MILQELLDKMNAYRRAANDIWSASASRFPPATTPILSAHC